MLQESWKQIGDVTSGCAICENSWEESSKAPTEGALVLDP